MTVATASPKQANTMEQVRRPSLWDLNISAGKKTRLYRMLYQFGPGNGTFITILAYIMYYLKVEGAVSEGGTSLNAFCTTYTEVFINGIFKERFFDIFPGYGSGWTEHGFSSSSKIDRPWFKIPTTKVAVSA